MSVEILNMLMEGFCLSKVAKMSGLSTEAIRKQALRYEREGVIIRVSKYPAMYQRKNQFQPPHKPVGDFNPTPTIIPKKFGALCAQVGKPNLTYDEWGKAYDGDEYTHTIQFGRHKAQIWLKAGFIGTTPEEMKANGIRQLEALAAHYAKKHGIRLSILRIYDDLEWVVISRKTSAEIAQSAKIPKGGAIECAGAIHKYGDFSDPNNVQFNAKPKGEPKIPTEQAIIHHFVYSGDMGRLLETMGKLEVQFNERIMKLEAHQ